MNKIYRILIVIILLMVVAIIAMDYLAFHGTILLDKVGNGAIVGVFDAFGGLFEGKDAWTNFMFVAVISVGLLVALIAIIYKFIKG